MIKDFDLIDSVTKAYGHVWQNREYAARLAVVPFSATIALTLFLLAMNWEANLLRYALLMIPAWFTQGWMTAQFLRTLLTGERWPYIVDLNQPYDQNALFWRVRGLIAAILVFVLVKMAVGAMMAALFMAVPLEAVGPDAAATAAAQGETGTLTFFMILSVMAMMIWMFPIFWLYIPAVINIPLALFIRRMAGMMKSAQLIGVWLVVIVPISALLFFLQAFLLAPYAGDVHAANAFIVVLLVALQSACEMILTLVSVTAITFAVMAPLRDMAAGGGER